MAEPVKQDTLTTPKTGETIDLAWYSPKDPPFHVAGLAWFAQEGIYRRLPKEPEHPIRPPVDALADCTSGGQIRFRTDARHLAVRVELKAPASMDHMPATGQCGFDCYVEAADGLRYLSTTRGQREGTTYDHLFCSLDEARTRYVMLNFPLYQGVQEVLVGLTPGAQVHAPPAYEDERRVVVYGTSITQGGCAARAGTSTTNILSRWLNLEFINLGFSGNGKGEPELAHLMADIESVGCFVLDYEANATLTIRDSLEPFIRILRETHAEAPILVVSRTRTAGEAFLPEKLQTRLDNKQFQEGLVARLREAGDANIHFQDGGVLLGERWEECTVDGGHPTDLGFMHMADALEPMLRGLLFG